MEFIQFLKKAKTGFHIWEILEILEIIFYQKPVSAKAEFKKNRDGMGFMKEGDVRIIITRL